MLGCPNQQPARVVHMPVLVHCPSGGSSFARDVLVGVCSGFLIWFLFFRKGER
jgi:hypothetical protein